MAHLDDCAVLVHPTESASGGGRTRMAENAPMRFVDQRFVLFSWSILDVIGDDPGDNRILECAIAAQAGCIVSGDNHLLRLGGYRGIRIMKVVDFMVLLPTLDGNGTQP